MPDQDPLNKLISEFGPAIANAVGPLPFTGTSWSSSSSPMFDANAVGSEILGVSVDLSKDRNALLGALERAFPLKKGPSGKAVLEYRRGSDAMAANHSDFPLVGPLKSAAVALRSLSDHASSTLDDIEPIDPHAGDHCAHEPIVELIRSTIEALNRQFATGRPLVQAVDVLVETLIGWNPASSDEPPSGVNEPPGGYVGDLGRRIGFGPNPEVEDETIATNFGTLAVFARIFASVWSEARKLSETEFFTIGVQDLQRHLFAIVTTLNRLRSAVPAERWLATEIPTEPPMVAAAFWQWMYRYSGTTALEMLRQGRDGIFGLNLTMSGFATVLQKLITAETRKSYRGSKQNADPCQGVPGAFEDEEVQDIVRELQCHVDGLIRATEPQTSRCR